MAVVELEQSGSMVVNETRLVRESVALNLEDDRMHGRPNPLPFEILLQRSRQSRQDREE